MKTSKPLIAFEMEKISLPLGRILPIRSLKAPERQFGRYLGMRDSIVEMGLVEPLVVYPDKSNAGMYVLVDGHMRYAALKELKFHTVECIIATEDEAFTYNARINRLSPIQEHQMITKAVKNGVSPERIAKTLKLKVEDILARMNLLDGIHPEAVDLLKEKQITPQAIGIIRKVSDMRQIEMAELMVSANNYTKSYADALFMGTPNEELVKPKKVEVKGGLSSKEIAQMEHEMESVEHDFKAVEANYGQNVLNLTLIRGYVRRLLENKAIARYLKANHHDMLTEMRAVAAMGSLDAAVG